jgi:hypothetical protein
MQAGRMKYKVRLLKPETVECASGAKRIEYSETVVAWAERRLLSGQRSDEVWEHFADYTAVYNIRDAHRVDTGWRLDELGGHLYTIVAVEPNRNRGMLTLRCERVNE